MDIQQFMERWQGHGYEKGEMQTFWLMLFRVLFSIDEPEDWLIFEHRIKGKFIDARIPSTHVLIEQKSIDRDLNAAFLQAKSYDALLPFKDKSKWIVVSDFQSFHVYDMDLLDPKPEIILLENLERERHRLNFLVDENAARIRRDRRISVKAGEIIGKLYDALQHSYIKPEAAETIDALNKLCVRLVFCLYAENAGLFDKKSFCNYLNGYKTPQLRAALIRLFAVLNQSKRERDPYLEDELQKFPYVDGGLFEDGDIEIPNFNEDSRFELLTRAADFDWAEISPPIFGAIFEATLNPETRRTGGMHYTSIENIHKVIDPLFLTHLRDEFEQCGDDPELLSALQNKIARLKFFDPACGSGNFLTETYIKLRELEDKILKRLPDSTIQVSIGQFYGIEINNFAVAVAKTALWIAESQMIAEDARRDRLPLRTSAHIVEANALKIDWREVIPDGVDFIMGNPPFLGASMMNATQKAEVVAILGKGKLINSVDYVGAWYHKAAAIMVGTKIRAAFVSTNSITQGEQVAPLWKRLLGEYKICIDFAYRTFRWEQERDDEQQPREPEKDRKRLKQAAVHCVIIGFSSAQLERHRIIFDGERIIEAENINPYLVDAPDILVESRATPLCSNAPRMVYGNKPSDGGNLILSEAERNQLLKTDPKLEVCIRRYIGGKDFINQNVIRYCLWLKDIEPGVYRNNREIMRRLDAVKKFRAASTSKPTRDMAEYPYLFFFAPQTGDNYLCIPRISSERRQYIPIGFLDKSCIAADALQIMPNATLFHFGVLISSVHMSWMRRVCGRLEMRYNYSVSVVYNNFVWCAYSPEIERTAQRILDVRAKFSNSTLADLYDERTMPKDLRAAHAENDRAVLDAYGFSRDMSEAEIVSKLMDMYQKSAATSAKKKLIFDGDQTIEADHINPYLVDAPDILVESRGRPLCDVPQMFKGNYASSDGNLILSEAERKQLLTDDPKLEVCIRRYIGAHDFLNNDEVRYCLWLKDIEPGVFRKNREIMRRLDAVKKFRAASSAKPTRDMAKYPYLFFSAPQTDEDYLCIPSVSSERRQYIPIGFMDRSIIASDRMLIVPGATLFHFGVLESSVHMAWMRAVGMRRGLSYSYSGAVVYNTFPWCSPSHAIERTAQRILDVRAKFSNSTLADLYDDRTMPKELRAAHAENDRAVLDAYGFSRDMSEAEIVSKLMDMYQKSAATSAKKKLIFDGDQTIEADHINPYLVDAPDILVESRATPLCSDAPVMMHGNWSGDGKNLILSEAEREQLLKTDPKLEVCVRRLIGGRELIYNEIRYCLWLKDIEPGVYRKSREIMRRLDAVREFRAASTSKDTRDKADVPYLFFRTPQTDADYLCLPQTSSERRKYLPIGFFDRSFIAIDTVLIVPNATLYHFGVLVSSVHMAWMRAVGGRFGTGYRYSTSVVYNNFPWCSPSPAIERTAQRILDVRAKFSNSTLADLYDDRTMPKELRAAHLENDRAVLDAYGFARDMSEAEIVSKLMDMYQKLASTSAKKKLIFDGDQTIEADHINPYLVDAPDILIESRTTPICSNAPRMTHGNKPSDGGNLILSEAERDRLLQSDPKLEVCIRRYVGGNELINGGERYCLWLKDVEPSVYRKSREIMRRLDAVREFRAESTSKPTRDMAKYPYLFFNAPQTDADYLCIPEISSDRRRYIPIGFMDRSIIASNKVLIIPDAELFHFGVLISSVHMSWMRAVGGRFGTGYQYSTSVVYNTFPWCSPSPAIERTAARILEVRAKYPNSTLADLYDERTMPKDLRAAHLENDRAVLDAYGFARDMSEPEIVARLMDMYQKMTAVSAKKKLIFDGDQTIEADHINPYLVDAPDILVESRATPICSEAPRMILGNKPTDDGNLILSEEERDRLLQTDPKLETCIRRYVGARDFINQDEVRYCLWLKDVEPNVYRNNREIMRRLDAVKKFRAASTSKATRDMAARPGQFFFISQPTTNYIIIPSTTSGERQYIPMGFLPPTIIASNSATIIPNADLYHFGVLESSVHMAWMRVVAGYLGTSYRYSTSVVYNTFPWCARSERIEKTAARILEVRAKYPHSTLADLYDNRTMPDELRAAHIENDNAVLDAYGFDRSLDEAEIVARLMSIYAELTCADTAPFDR